MAITEVTSTGWLGRIGNSIKGILFGVLMIVISLGVLVFNERNAVKDIRANKEIAKEVVTVGSEEVNSDHEGTLVHLNGPARTEAILKNEQFGIAENAIRLKWTAQIFQWVEKKESKTRKKTGGGEETITTYTYAREWVAKPIDSTKFKEPNGHRNKGSQNYHSGSQEAKKVTLGAFHLGPGLISQIEKVVKYELKALPSALEGRGRIVEGSFFTGEGENPVVGDENVVFKITHADDVSVMAVQAKESFAPFQTKSGKSKYLLSEGLLTAEEMVAGEEKKAAVLRWALRGGGVLLMFIGFCLIMKPLSVVADVIPLIGNLVGGATTAISLLLSLGISFVVIAICWVTFRPMVGIPLLLVGAGCFVLLLKKMAQNKQATKLPPIPSS